MYRRIFKSDVYLRKDLLFYVKASPLGNWEIRGQAIWSGSRRVGHPAPRVAAARRRYARRVDVLGAARARDAAMSLRGRVQKTLLRSALRTHAILRPT